METLVGKVYIGKFETKLKRSKLVSSGSHLGSKTGKFKLESLKLTWKKSLKLKGQGHLETDLANAEPNFEFGERCFGLREPCDNGEHYYETWPMLHG